MKKILLMLSCIVLMNANSAKASLMVEVTKESFVRATSYNPNERRIAVIVEIEDSNGYHYYTCSDGIYYYLQQSTKTSFSGAKVIPATRIIRE